MIASNMNIIKNAHRTLGVRIFTLLISAKANKQHLIRRKNRMRRPAGKVKLARIQELTIRKVKMNMRMKKAARRKIKAHYYIRSE